MKNRSIHTGIGASLMVLAASLSTQAVAQDAQAAEDVGIEEIVVTGTKNARADSLQRVPAAVTAITPSVLEEAQITSIVDVGRMAPNVQFQTGGSFPGYANFSMRGIGANNTIRTIDPAISLVVDGMVYAFPLGTLVDTFDVEAVEIFRGPQGILFGRNAIGGAVSIRTRRPTNELSIEAEMRVGNVGRFDQSFSIGGPLSDTLRAKVAVLHRKTNGTSPDRGGGTFVAAPYNPSGADPAGSSSVSQISDDSWAIRPTIVWDATPDLEVTLLGEYITSNGGGGNARLRTSTAALANQFGYTPPAFGYEINQNLRGESDVEAIRGALEINWNVGVGTITSITGYRDVKYRMSTDNDGTPFSFLEFPNNEDRGKQFSQETRFASDFSDSLRFVVGGYYSTLDMDTLELRRTSSFISSPNPPFVIRDLRMESEQKSKTAAAFGNIDWKATEALTLTAGLRYSWEHKEIDVVPLGLCTGPNFTSCPTNVLHVERSWNDLSPKLGANYQVTEDVMAYASYTKGFRSGNFNNRGANLQGIGPVNPENAAAYEVGLKTSFWDRRIRLNLAAFRTNYSNIQRDINIGGTQTLVNAAKATIDGAEFELTVQPTRGLQFDVSVGHLNARYKRFEGLDVNGGGYDPVVDAALARNLKLDRVPKWTATVAGSYSFELPGVPGEFSARTSYAWRSQQYANVLNTAPLLVDAYEIVDASFSWEPDDRWRVTAYGRNLTNSNYFDVGTTFQWGTAVFGGEARTYGIAVGFRY